MHEEPEDEPATWSDALRHLEEAAGEPGVRLSVRIPFLRYAMQQLRSAPDPWPVEEGARMRVLRRRLSEQCAEALRTARREAENYEILNLLEEGGFDADALLPDLIALTRRGSPAIRPYVISALKALAVEHPDVRRIAAGMVGDSNPLVRATAIEILARWGWAAPQDVRATCERALNDIHPPVRQAAAEAVAWLGNPSPKVYARLEELTRDASETVRESAAQAIGYLRGAM